MDSRELITRRVAQLFQAGDVINLGIGMPTLVAGYLPDGVYSQSENGYIGIGPTPEPGTEDFYVVNAGGQPASIVPGGAFFDSATSFGIIRGGHLAATVLGALEVDEEGNLANWIVPGKMVPGMGGAMDLVVGARMVVIAMEHTTKKGEPKILKKCRLPLTAAKEVDLIITELGMIRVTPKGLVLEEVAPGVTVEQVVQNTEAHLIISENVKTYAQ